MALDASWAAQYLARGLDVVTTNPNPDAEANLRKYVDETWEQLARLIGDRSIQEKEFGTIQIDRIKEMKKVARNFRKDSDEGNLSRVKFSIVAANNHYAGFAPGTTNIFRQLLGLEEVKWEDKFIGTDDLEIDDDTSADKRVIKTKQTSLSDFLK